MEMQKTQNLTKGNNQKIQFDPVGFTFDESAAVAKTKEDAANKSNILFL